MNSDLIKVVNDNQRLIYSIANKYKSYYNIEDLYQVGCIGIIKAYRNYNNKSNVKFSTYAYKYIMGEMIDYVKNDRNIKIGNEYMTIYKKYVEIKNLLTIKYEKEPTFKEVCLFMKIDETKLLNIIQTISFTISNDNINYDFGSDERDELDNKILLDRELDNLCQFDKNLINYRYYQGFSQHETAQALGVTQVKVSRQEKLILSKIKSNICS